MKPPIPQTRLSTSADSLIVQLKVAPTLAGLTPTSVLLESQDKSITVKLPSAALPNLRAEGGDLIVLGMFLVKTVFESISDFEAGLIKGLDS